MIAALDPRLWLAFIVAIVVSVSGGYFWGSHAESVANEAKQNKALNEALTKVRTAEAKLSIEINGVSNEYETKLAALNNRAVIAERDLIRLRVKPRCSLPTIAPGPGELDATPGDGTDGPRTGEINLDDVAKQTVELGRDFDAANIHIIELQSLVRKYENACRVE
ncbi:MAG: hypothetical protein A2Y38_12835 [Spirochaetes bacterium GWB1_59_5]|nr:MAG: hypothetical protein A2Y38_12835 [Spirochaetes bacterium GWB1_59_5]